MATSRVNGYQLSVRDVYPNMGYAQTQSELTSPEKPELELYGNPTTASADTSDGASVSITSGHKFSLLAVVAVLVLLAVAFGYVQPPKVG